MKSSWVVVIELSFKLENNKILNYENIGWDSWQRRKFRNESFEKAFVCQKVRPMAMDSVEMWDDLKEAAKEVRLLNKEDLN